MTEPKRSLFGSSRSENQKLPAAKKSLKGVTKSLLLLLIAATASAAPKKKKKQPAPPPSPPPPVEVAPEPEPAPEPAKPLEEPAQPKVDAEVVAVAPPPEHALKHWTVRAGVALIKPLSSSRPMELANVDGAASLALQNGPIAGSGAEVSSATIPALIIGYNINDHLSLETVLGLPFTVKFQATGTLANESIAPTALGIPTGVGPLGPELGEAKAAPPLVTVVYKFLHPEDRFRPYVGAGASVLIAYDAKVTNPMLIEVAKPAVGLQRSRVPAVVVR